MTPPAFFGLFSQSDRVSFEDCQRMAASVQAQLDEDFTPVWGRKATITAYHSEDDVPAHVWKVAILDALDQPGALGYHTDDLNQPQAFVQAAEDLNDTCVTVSHEVLETVVDFSGNRLAPNILHPKNDRERVRMLIEVCDPSERLTYEKRGLQVSDFYHPEWLDDVVTPGQKYTHLDGISHPRRIIAGGYCSFVDAQGRWWQLRQFGTMIAELAGPFHWDLKDGKSLREMVDEEVRNAQAAILTGKCSSFGGPEDMGVATDEGLALMTERDLADPKFKDLFLAAQPEGTTGLARRLDPEALYCAMRWATTAGDAGQMGPYGRRLPRAASHATLRNGPPITVRAHGKEVRVRPVDFGPNGRTGRLIDLSPGALKALGVGTDEEVTVVLPW